MLNTPSSVLEQKAEDHQQAHRWLLLVAAERLKREEAERRLEEHGAESATGRWIDDANANHSVPSTQPPPRQGNTGQSLSFFAALPTLLAALPTFINTLAGGAAPGEAAAIAARAAVVAGRVEPSFEPAVATGLLSLLILGPLVAVCWILLM